MVFEHLARHAWIALEPRRDHGHQRFDFPILQPREQRKAPGAYAERTATAHLEIVGADRKAALLQRDADRLRTAWDREHRRVLERVGEPQQARSDDRPRIETRLRSRAENEE